MTALVIMAAGLGSRYNGPKQLEKVGPNNETLMDFAIKYAYETNFKKVYVVTRKEIFQEMKRSLQNSPLPIEYCFQELSQVPSPFSTPESRKKPWGTGHVLYILKNVVHEDFVILNADDYYGKECFVKAMEFYKDADKSYSAGLVGFPILETLSKHGTVSRGVCKVQDDKLISIEEHKKIALDSGILKDHDKGEVSKKATVSMNFWCFRNTIFEKIHKEIILFYKNCINDERAEFLIPEIVNTLVRQNNMLVKVLPTNEKWFGITYPEDKKLVIESLKAKAD